MNDIGFYDYTERSLLLLAARHGIDREELERYYSHTDGYCDFYRQLSGVPRVFAQMAFHAQNATMLSNIVRFEKNFDFLRSVICGFEPKPFLGLYGAEDGVKKLVDALRYDHARDVGLRWNDKKATKKNKDMLVGRFAGALIGCARYLEAFSSREEVLADLHSHAASYNELITYFRSRVKVGFSVALTCDMLKELDGSFSYLPKPDIHIKDVMCSLRGRPDGYYSTEKRELELVGEMQALTDSINAALVGRGSDPITVYRLDRMIWLACTESFFLHGAGGAKERYLEGIHK